MKKPIRLKLAAVALLASVLAFAAFPVHANAPVPTNFRFFTEVALLAYGTMVMEAQDGALWAAAPPQGMRSIQSNLFVLKRSFDHGNTWEHVYRFARPIETVYADDFGNIFVATSMGRWDRRGSAEIFKSSDGGNSFRRVLEMISGAPFHWNFASQNGLMFVSEYGFKGPGDNARRIYRSVDFGETWEIVFEPAPMHNYHNHKILIAGDVVYQSVGDRPHNRIMRSMDFGETWELAVDGIHPTGGVAFDTHILWGLDSGGFPNSGVAWYNRLTGEIDFFWHPPYPFEGSSYSIGVANGIVYATFLSYAGHYHPASIFFSKDEGLTWELLGFIQKYPNEGIGFWALTFDDTFGYIDIQTPVHFEGSERLPRYRGTLRFRLLDY